MNITQEEIDALYRLSGELVFCAGKIKSKDYREITIQCLQLSELIDAIISAYGQQVIDQLKKNRKS